MAEPSTTIIASSSLSSSSDPAFSDSRTLSTWYPPAKLLPQQVLPDRYTDSLTLSSQIGKETDPSRMGIYICLLDDKPHLHPTLSALHKHRLTMHAIPLPIDLNENPKQGEWITWRFSIEEEGRRKAYLPLA